MAEHIHKLGRESFFDTFADSSVNRAFVEAKFKDADPALCYEFLESVDDSPFSLSDWVDALRCLEQWLEVRDLTMGLDDQFGYVCCVSAAVDAGANLTHLPSLVDEMLEAYGCERAVHK